MYFLTPLLRAFLVTLITLPITQKVLADAFVMRGVDTITGRVNGFLNLSPALGSVASQFSLSGFSSLNTYANSTVDAFASVSVTLNPSDYGYGSLLTFADPQTNLLNNNLNGVATAGTLSGTGGFAGDAFLTNTSNTGFISNQASNAFEYMGNTSFATFAMFQDMSSATVAYDYSQLKIKNSFKPYINITFKDPNGNLLTPTYSTYNNTTTVSLEDSLGAPYDPRASGGATLTFNESSSIANFATTLTGSRVTTISPDGSTYLVHSGLTGTDYLGTPLKDSKTSITNSDFSLSFLDASDDFSVLLGYDGSKSSLPDMSITNGFTYSLDGSGFLLNADATYTNLGNIKIAKTCGAADCSTFSTDISPSAISGDGLTVIGNAMLVNKEKLSIGDLANSLYSDSFIWDATNGIRLLNPTSSYRSVANAINEDGSIVVGSIDNANGTEAFIWDSGTLNGLGDLAGGRFFSVATGVSNDGSIITGYSDIGSTSSGVLFEAFRWTNANGMTGLGTPSNTTSSMAIDISGNGNVIVGTMGDFSTKTIDAFRWDSTNGIQKITEWLTSTGVNVPSSLNLDAATTVNNDGSAIGGTSSGKAWLAYAGRGVIYPDEYSASLNSPEILSDINFELSSLSLEGVHHRALKTMALTGENCYWINGDLSNTESTSSKSTIGEIGFCGDYSKDLRYGIGLGKSSNTKSIPNSIDAQINGEYFYGEVGFNTGHPNLITSISSIVGKYRSSLKRYYTNMGNLEYSTGRPDIKTSSLKLRLDAMNIASFNDFLISPSASVTRNYIDIDSYTETDGGFPATINKQKKIITDLRLGLAAEKQIDHSHKVRLLADRYIELSHSTNGVSGTVTGWNDFSSNNYQSKATRTRLGMELDAHLENEWLFSGLISLSDINNDGDFMFALSLKHNLH